MVRETEGSRKAALEATAYMAELRPFRRYSEVRGTVMQDGGTDDSILAVAVLIARLGSDATLLAVTQIPASTSERVGFPHQSPVLHLAAGEVSRESEAAGAGDPTQTEDDG
ncbi:MAG: hypothetical protein MUC77_13765 [Chromatiaceae bacterium]|jgi:hypothetical protein|nr:hypothetical protein [Chromatiaceae bacterium]